MGCLVGIDFVRRPTFWVFVVLFHYGTVEKAEKAEARRRAKDLETTQRGAILALHRFF